jgi:phosphoglycolate phosphatase
LACGLAKPVASVRTWSELPQVSADFDRAYVQRCGTRSHLYPHAREVLHALAAQGVRLVVVTNKEARFTQVVLQAHGLMDSFDLVISGDTLPTKKPHPGAIAHCLERFQLQAHQALFIGDSSIDAATARNAGVRVWLLPYGYNMGEPVQSAQPDRVIPDLSVLVHFLETSL